MALIGVSIGKELEYSRYLNTIAKDINRGGNAEVFINNYDYNYVFVLTNNNGWKLQLYHCFPPNSVVGLLSVKAVYWNVSTINNGEDVVFAPALVFCKLVKQKSLYIEQINISIQGLNDDAGLLALDFGDANLDGLQIIMTLEEPYPPTTFLAILNDTTITCNDGGCTFISTINENGNTYEESGPIFCVPNPNINNNNFPFNPSDCVELSGFPLIPQVTLSNFVGEITFTDIDNLYQTFQTNFPLLYFAGSLPPTAMYIYISSNPNPQDRTADINIYIGETVS
jgi:hypothetical protein